MYYKQVDEKMYFDTFSKRYVPTIAKERTLEKLSIEQIGIVKECRNRNALNIVVTITSECDLRCAYCFENHLQRESMSLETCTKLLGNIKRYIENNEIKTVECILFGGEPMLNQELLEWFTCELNTYCKNNNIDLSMLLTTNGVIFNKCLMEKLANNGVNGVQLSFDGTELINNRRRCPKDNKCNPYKEIMNNIEKFIEIFNVVSIKYNFDQDNSDEYPAFLIDLEKSVGEHKDRVSIILETINETPFEEYGMAYDVAGKELALQFVEMVKTTIEMGFKYVTRIFVSPCMHTSQNSYLIDTKGNAYSCISSFGIDEFKIGEFTEKIQEASARKRNEFNKVEKLKEHCSKCSYVPLCWGGCAYVLKSAGKDICKDLQCRRTYFDTLIQTFYEEITLRYGVNKIE